MLEFNTGDIIKIYIYIILKEIIFNYQLYFNNLFKK